MPTPALDARTFLGQFNQSWRTAELNGLFYAEVYARKRLLRDQMAFRHPEALHDLLEYES